MEKFMVLLYENDNAWAKLSPEEKQEIMKRYFAWVDELKTKDILRGGEALAAGGRVLRMAGGQVLDGPFTETKEVLTGFFLLAAPNLEEAVKIARGCPALSHGESVVVRPVGHT